jgi:hypothetical protein
LKEFGDFEYFPQKTLILKQILFHNRKNKAKMVYLTKNGGFSYPIFIDTSAEASSLNRSSCLAPVLAATKLKMEQHVFINFDRL